MTSFKQYLKESTTGLDLSKLSLSQVIDAMGNAGYETQASERKWFKEAKFGDGKKPFYWVRMHDENSDEDAEELQYITKLFLEIGTDGLIKLEPSGAPSFEGTASEMKAKFGTL